MYRVLLGALLAASLTGGAAAQVVRYGVMGDSARAMLRAAWTDDSAQSERAYCVRRARIVTRPVSDTGIDSIFRVLEVRPVHVIHASPNHVEFECARGTPELHTHTPATCLGDAPEWCVSGGPDAYSCQPSRDDYAELIRRGDPYGIIQCDRRAFRFYYPSDYVATPARRDDRPVARPVTPGSTHGTGDSTTTSRRARR